MGFQARFKRLKRRLRDMGETYGIERMAYEILTHPQDENGTPIRPKHEVVCLQRIGARLDEEDAKRRRRQISKQRRQEAASAASL